MAGQRKRRDPSAVPPPLDDGLLIAEVGPQSRDKHYFLRRYLYAFMTSMKNKRWSSLHYIDLFAGAGIERVDSDGALEWGSPLIAAQIDPPFTAMHLCEVDRAKCDALQIRIQQLGADSRSFITCGDANIVVHTIIQRIPSDALSIAFLDPYGLQLRYETLEVLAARRCDLVIFFPDYLDATRNAEINYREQAGSNLDHVLGPGADWRRLLQDRPRSAFAEGLRELYSTQIQKLGYKPPEMERIALAQGARLYMLMFFSKDDFAIGLWQRTARTKPGGQRTFGFADPE